SLSAARSAIASTGCVPTACSCRRRRPTRSGSRGATRSRSRSGSAPGPSSSRACCPPTRSAGASAEAVAARLRSEMPPGVVVEPADADAERGASLSRSYRVNLNVLSLVALFTGGLLVFSSQALAVVRRRAQLALLRVLGVTRGGIVALLLGEAAVTGAAGAAAGI